MLESIQSTFERLVEQVELDKYRFLYDQFNLNNRLTGIIGPRGVGKTTLMLQYIKQHYKKLNKVFYFSADHIYFKSTTLYEFVEELYIKHNIRFVFIDEIHKYSNWSQELKNLYDGFPDLTIVFSGSSSLDLVKGSYDLSRRAKLYHLPGLSFREYINFLSNTDFAAHDFTTLMDNYQSIAKQTSTHPGILGLFHDYLKQGFYPFFLDDPLSYHEKLLMIIEKTIYEDIASFYSLKTGNLAILGKILNYLASIPPGTISSFNIGKNLNINDKTVSSYLVMLSETGLVDVIYPAESGNQGLRRPAKIFLNNTNLHYALASLQPNPIDIGTVRELAFIQLIKNSHLQIYHNKQTDYQVNEYVYEIGGKNKTRKQVKNIENAYLVKDDIVSAVKGTIPLFLFGFLY